MEDPRITPLQLFNSSNINNNHTPPSSTTNHASNFENPSSGGRLACGVLSILAQKSLVQFSSLRAVGNCPIPWLAAGNSLEIAFKDFETIFSLHRLLTIVYIVHCVNVGPLQSLRLGLVWIGLGPIPKISAGFVVVVRFTIYGLDWQSRIQNLEIYLMRLAFFLGLEFLLAVISAIAVGSASRFLLWTIWNSWVSWLCWLLQMQG